MKKITPRIRIDHRALTARRSLLLLLILGASPVFGQTDSGSDSGVPEGPLLQAAPDFSQWIVTYSYPEDHAPKDTGASGSPASPAAKDTVTRFRTIATTKTKDIIHETITDTQQHQRENWFVGSTQYRKDANSVVWFVNIAEVHADFSYTPMPANGFRDLDWISAETYSGKASRGGTNCLMFKTNRKLASVDLAIPRGKELPLVAYIDAKTRLPVELDIDKETRTYSFSSPPQEAQSLPADLLKQIKDGQAGRAFLAQPAARPY
jgi:hypothetical protein